MIAFVLFPSPGVYARGQNQRNFFNPFRDERCWALPLKGSNEKEKIRHPLPQA